MLTVITTASGALLLVPYMLPNDGKLGLITWDDTISAFYRVWYSDWQRGLGGSFLCSLDADFDGQEQDLPEAMQVAQAFLPVLPAVDETSSGFCRVDVYAIGVYVPGKLTSPGDPPRVVILSVK